MKNLLASTSRFASAYPAFFGMGMGVVIAGSLIGAVILGMNGFAVLAGVGAVLFLVAAGIAAAVGVYEFRMSRERFAIAFAEIEASAQYGSYSR